MRRIIEIFGAITIILLFLTGCSSTGSSVQSESLDERINRTIKQQLAVAEHKGKSVEVVWGYDLKILKKDKKEYWTGRVVHFRGGFLSAKVKVKKDFSEGDYFVRRGEIKRADIIFAGGCGVEKGEVVTETTKVADILFEDEPGYAEKKKKLIKEMRALNPFQHWG